MNRPSSGGNNVVIYSEDKAAKDIHQNFVIVFGVTFAGIVMIVLIICLVNWSVCKLFSCLKRRKVRNLLGIEEQMI